MQTRERLLRETIRELLREAAGPGKSDELIDRMVDMNARLEDLAVPFKISVGFEDLGDEIQVFYAWIDEKEGEPRHIFGTSVIDWIRANISGKDQKDALHIALEEVPFGSTEFSRAGWDMTNDGSCAGAHIVRLTRQTRPGWGPLLYDVAMEIATDRGGSLTSDRESVSKDALGVWRSYDTGRGDVEKIQMDISKSSAIFYDSDEDDYPAQLTPDDTSDDCVQDSTLAYSSPDEWHKSPLSRTYRKSSTALPRLRSLGLLFVGEGD